jgi:hypothetical protein
MFPLRFSTRRRHSFSAHRKKCGITHLQCALEGLGSAQLLIVVQSHHQHQTKRGADALCQLAANLLRYHHYTITQAAQEVGIPDLPYFTRLFKRTIEETLSHYAW